MVDSERPQSPFAGMVDFSARTPVRALSPGEIERMLSEHRLYLETEYHQGHRANFSSADLTGRDFSGLNLRGIKMDRALLSGADFVGAHLQSANLIGAIGQEACFDRADLSRARLSGANLVSASLENACLARAELEFALMANALLQGVCLGEADLSGAQLDAAVLTGADLRKANLRRVTRCAARCGGPTRCPAGWCVPGRGVVAGRRFAGRIFTLGKARRCGSVRCRPGWRRRLDAGSARSSPLQQQNKAARRVDRGRRC